MEPHEQVLHVVADTEALRFSKVVTTLPGGSHDDLVDQAGLDGRHIEDPVTELRETGAPVGIAPPPDHEEVGHDAAAPAGEFEPMVPDGPAADVPVPEDDVLAEDPKSPEGPVPPIAPDTQRPEPVVAGEEQPETAATPPPIPVVVHYRGEHGDYPVALRQDPRWQPRRLVFPTPKAAATEPTVPRAIEEEPFAEARAPPPATVLERAEWTPWRDPSESRRGQRFERDLPFSPGTLQIRNHDALPRREPRNHG